MEYSDPKSGPLTPFVGEWEGDIGANLSYHRNTKTSYFEKAWFKPIPIQDYIKQAMHDLTCQSTGLRHR